MLWKGQVSKYLSRRVACWDSVNGRLLEFITNNIELLAEEIARIYKKDGK